MDFHSDDFTYYLFISPEWRNLTTSQKNTGIHRVSKFKTLPEQGLLADAQLVPADLKGYSAPLEAAKILCFEQGDMTMIYKTMKHGIN